MSRFFAPEPVITKEANDRYEQAIAAFPDDEDLYRHWVEAMFALNALETYIQDKQQ